MRRRRWKIQATVVLLAGALLLPSVRTASCQCADGCLSPACCGCAVASPSDGTGYVGSVEPAPCYQKPQRRAPSCCESDTTASAGMLTKVEPDGDPADPDQRVTPPAECCDCGGPVAGPSAPFIVSRETSCSVAVSHHVPMDVRPRARAGHHGHRQSARPPPLSAQARCSLLCRWLK